MQQDETTNAGSFLVCGLGNLGQSCISLLKEFGAEVNAVEIGEPNWQIPNLADLLNKLVIGDCRQANILEEAGVYYCRTILIVTSNDGVNIATAFVARSLNPNIRVLIRSAQENLNELLRENLGNFDAFEVTRLPARSFALAALGTETRGLFYLENKLLKVVGAEIGAMHPWLGNRQISSLNNSTRRVLIHARASQALPKVFYEWELNTEIRFGDRIAYIEVTDSKNTQLAQQSASRSQWRRLAIGKKWKNLQENLLDWWKNRSQSERAAMLYAPFMAVLFVLGTALYWWEYHQMVEGFLLEHAINDAIVLLIGGFDNMFGALKLSFKIPWWLYLFSLFLTFVGTVFSSIIYAIITERLLAYRFQFSMRRPSIPKSDHVVLVGLGRVGQRVAAFLQEYKQPVVGVNLTELEPGVLPQMPVVIGNIKQALKRVNVTTAKSVIAVTNDEVLNLEIALGVRAIHPTANLAIRTFDPTFSQSVAQLLPHGRVMNVYNLSAEVFVAAAFGDNILSLFRLNNQTTLVTEYNIKDNDSLNGKLLAEVAYGYGVVPILHQESRAYSAELIPSDDIKLGVGDRLIVLATTKGLRRVELGIANQKNWLVQIDKINSPETASEAAAIISRISGCDINIAKTLMSQLPQALPFKLYKHQAQRLVNELRKVQVVAWVKNK